MSQASAQREPSMEEILSSIRRIIEDSDTGNDNAQAARQAESDGKTMPGDEVVEEIDAFLEELSDSKPVEEVIKPEPANQDRAAVMKDVTPSAAAEPAAAKAPVTATALRDETPAAASQGSASAKAAEPAASVAAKPVETAVKAVETTAKPSPGEPVVKPAGAPVTAAADTAPKPQTPASAPVSEQAPAKLQPIVSEETGRQVQAAFGELSEAFQKSRAKSFDQMAEEMIRPMLQDWLDNNLPTLVERLVREEIERVARGE